MSANPRLDGLTDPPKCPGCGYPLVKTFGGWWCNVEQKEATPEGKRA